jgi:hypothetical protein
VNALAGREITLGKRSTFTIDGKLTGSGGRYLTPIDFGRSAQDGRAIYRNHEAFSQQAQDYFRADVKVSYRMNLKRVTHEFAVDAQNITNRKNIFMQRYNPRLNQVVTEYQLGLFIIPQYRILF